MYCPLCGAEYRPGFTVCSDCQVSLVPDPPSESPSESADSAATGGTSFAPVWSGSDTRKLAEICEELDRQKIPTRTLRREDRLFNPTAHAPFEVYVPIDRMTAARKAINEADPAEDDSEPISESDSLEIPAEEGSPDDDGDDGYEDERGELRNLDPEDATAEIWSGDDVDLAAMITSSLRENHIPYRSDSDTPEPQSDFGGNVFYQAFRAFRGMRSGRKRSFARSSTPHRLTESGFALNSESGSSSPSRGTARTMCLAMA